MAAANPIAVSFEFFPPGDDAAATQLWTSIKRLAPLRPRFVSVTQGADGSTRTRTQACVRCIANETDLTVVPHLTCVATAREDVLSLAASYWSEGRRHLVALRGDAPSTPGGTAGFAHASDLVRALRGIGDFDLSVAAFPEGHPESGSFAADIENLRRKVAAGANRAITQFFLNADLFLRYRDRCLAAGIEIPIVPGILPIHRFAQMCRFAAKCGINVPGWLHRRFEAVEQDPVARHEIAADVALELVRRLQRHGVREFHFYTLNRAEITLEVCRALGLPGTVPVRPMAARLEPTGLLTA
jgi:methylenetetrahydrofolate reductase (NADPH)